MIKTCDIGGLNVLFNIYLEFVSNLISSYGLALGKHNVLNLLQSLSVSLYRRDVVSYQLLHHLLPHLPYLQKRNLIECVCVRFTCVCVYVYVCVSCVTCVCFTYMCVSMCMYV